MLTRDVPVDQMLTYDDVELNEASTIVQMRRIQDAMAKDAPPPSLTDLRAKLAS